MRKILLILLFPTSFNGLQAQGVDSLKQDIISNPTDSNRVFTFLRLSNHYIDHNRDSAMYYAQEALSLAINIEFDKGEAQSRNFIGSILNKIGNYPKALEFHLDALKKAEKLGNDRLIYSTYNNIARVSTERSDFRTALDYYFNAKDGFIKIKDSAFLTIALLNIGDTYDRMDLFDSAFYFLGQARELAKMNSDNYNMAAITANLGDIFITANKISEAEEYFMQSLMIMKQDVNNNDQETLAGAYEGLSKVFEKKRMHDSALFYGYLSYQISTKIADQGRVLDAAKRLNKLYENRNTDSAYHYSKVANETRETILNERKISQMEALKFNEQLRQQDLAIQAEKKEKERKNNLQLIGIVLSIITFFTILIIFSRRRGHPKALKYLGLLGVLFLFEFIALFLHPYIDKLTNHDPVYMLLILVVVAAILVPLHHKMEHWVKERLAKESARKSQHQQQTPADNKEKNDQSPDHK
jgi:hypothetical protein